MDNSAEIDLYDNIEEDFVQVRWYNAHLRYKESSELTELYDDVMPTTSVKQDPVSLDSKVCLELFN